MTVFVMPDLIGHPVLSAGKRLPVGAGNDGEGPAMTVFVMPDLIGHLTFLRHARRDRASCPVGREVGR